MKKNNSPDMKQIIDVILKILFTIVCYMVQDIYTDVKQIREQIPAMKVEIDNLKDQDLIKRFKHLKVSLYMKEEPIITYDSLIKTEAL